MSSGPLEFWFEFGSTYSYVAALRVEEIARQAGAELAWRPFLLGPLFRRQGWDDSPFNLFQARGAYMWRDVERLCQKYGHPWKRPSRFPRNGLLASRVASLPEAAGWMAEFSREVYRANFVQDLEISDPAVIREVLEGLGQNAGAILEAARGPENKQRLREQTDRAWEMGIFGAPTFVVDGEVFWGNDRMEDALEWLKRKE